MSFPDNLLLVHSLSFHPLYLGFSRAKKFLILMRSTLSVFTITDHAFGVKSKIISLAINHKDFSFFLPKVFTLSVCLIMSKHLWKVYGLSRGLFFPCGCPLASALFIEKAGLCALNCFDNFIKSQLSVSLWVDLWVPAGSIGVWPLCHEHTVLITVTI